MFPPPYRPGAAQEFCEGNTLGGAKKGDPPGFPKSPNILKIDPPDRLREPHQTPTNDPPKCLGGLPEVGPTQPKWLQKVRKHVPTSVPKVTPKVTQTFQLVGRKNVCCQKVMAGVNEAYYRLLQPATGCYSLLQAATACTRLPQPVPG